MNWEWFSSSMRVRAQRHNGLFVLTLFVVSLIFVGVAESDELSSSALEDYYNSIDMSCSQDSDCEIKDVHNCCGYYPKCVNRNTVTNVQKVKEICSALKLNSICGFPSIKSCRCRDAVCIHVP